MDYDDILDGLDLDHLENDLENTDGEANTDEDAGNMYRRQVDDRDSQ